jgi:uncharacterized protein with von Willebrand factor type A (vWA) domain
VSDPADREADRRADREADRALRLARLARALRAHGVGVTLRDDRDAAEALAVLGLAADRTEPDRVLTRDVLRIALKIARADLETFDRLLPVFWGARERSAPAGPTKPRDVPVSGRLLHWDPETARMGGATGEGEQPGYSPDALLRRKPFDAGWSARDQVAMERLLVRLARRVATRRSRRLVPTSASGRADVRASFRRALRTRGELLALAQRTRAIEEPRVTFLLDTSGSMDAHTRFLLTFVLALTRAVPRAEAFAFNTALVRLTRAMTRGGGAGGPRGALERLSAAVPDWSGGTRIGDCLDAFAREHLARDPQGRTVVVVVSDGLDRGDPARLAAAVRAIRRRARRLVWINPLAGDPRYEPSAAGMRAALPFVDVFASAHDLDSLERLLPRLVA